MEADSWSRLFSTTSKRHQSSQQSRYDLYLGFEEIDGGEDESRTEFSCPFCAEDFDIFALCCHIDDEHPLEAKNGICPICATRVGMDLIGHITMQHGNFFKMQRRRRFRRGSSGTQSTLSLLRKELRDGNLQALIGGASHSVAPPSATPDPLLSSLIYTLPMADSSKALQSDSFDEGGLPSKTSEETLVERPCLSYKEQEERTRRSEFIQGLVFSTIFEGTFL
ncbi:Protein dehydration-induced 19 like 2 [Apostasia shenzhenica]|uniref:Protein dehydration-induced 19 like 2 n=1 Tax=Apostasia shenzhenica TaxID=1088818 RepID=A0A2H9ZXF6_9ASPA|nr:Protein dehydration-induced 19 like 2 [Apostasia shenzhenica]